MKILNFGSLNIDHVYNVKSFVSPGETIKSQSYTKKVGGKGLNQSIAMARSGSDVFHVGAIGEDGKFLVDFLKKDNVNVKNIMSSDVPTGHAIIQVDEKGENCILLYGGANQNIPESFVERVLANFSKDDWLILQNETNIASFVIDKASDKGMNIVFNPSPITENIADFPLEKVDWFILNETEGEALSGEKEIEKIISSLRSKFSSSKFILTLGEKGSVFFSKYEMIEVPAEKVEVVDTTAAGDTFTGYFVSYITKGTDVKTAMKIATKAAAEAIKVLGAAESIPYKRQVNCLVDKEI